MTVGGRAYVPDTDRASVLEWQGKHGKTWSPYIERCEGYFVPHLAVGWLVKTDAGFCMLEDMVTNPSAPSDLRNEAINELHRWAEQRAREHGSARLVAWIEHDGLLRRALSYGYKTGPMVLTLVKEL